MVKVDENGPTKIPVVNLDNKEHHMRSNPQVASLSVTEIPNETGKKDDEASIIRILQLKNCEEFVFVGDSLDDSQVHDLSRLFSRHLRALSINNELGRCELVEHEIELLPNSKPFRQPRRRHPTAQADEADRQVRDMLEQGIIEPWVPVAMG